MSEAKAEIEARLATASRELEETLAMRSAAEEAIREAEETLRERQEALESLLKKEGKLHAAVGELRRMREALDVTDG